jgi:hypothetical protein
LKDLAREIAPFLTRIFQSALNNGDVPKDWKYANVTVIFKKGDRFNASNYRPVALTCRNRVLKVVVGVELYQRPSENLR